MVDGWLMGGARVEVLSSGEFIDSGLLMMLRAGMLDVLGRGGS